MVAPVSHPHKPVMRTGTGDPLVASAADPALRGRRWRGGAPRLRSRAVHVLSSPAALAATFVVAVVGLLVAFYVTLAQINLTNCLAEYNDDNARSSAARLQAGAEDRALDLQERAVDTRDRRLKEVDDAAFDLALASVGTSRQNEAFDALRRARQATGEQRRDNDEVRQRLAAQRQRSELRRAQNPPPAPPSQRCG